VIDPEAREALAHKNTSAGIVYRQRYNLYLPMENHVYAFQARPGVYVADSVSALFGSFLEDQPMCCVCKIPVT